MDKTNYTYSLILTFIYGKDLIAILGSKANVEVSTAGTLLVRASGFDRY